MGLFSGDAPRRQEEAFRAPTAIVQMYNEIIHDSAIENWLHREHRCEEQERYEDAKKRFIISIELRNLPPEWIQAVVGGFILEYTTSSTAMGLAAGARALQYKGIAKWVEEILKKHVSE